MSLPPSSRLLILFVSVLSGVEPLAAQKLLPVEPGRRIRVLAPTVAGAPIIGNLLSMHSGMLRFTLEAGFPTFVVPLDSVARLEVSDGWATPSAGAVRGGGIGFVVGTIPSGLVLAGARCFMPDDGLPDACTPDIQRAAAVVIVASTAVGAVIGAVTPFERWRRVHLPIRLGAWTPSHGPAKALSVRVRRER